MTPAEYVASLVGQLVDGWEERIEYHVNIQTHVTLCQIRRSAMSPAKRKHHQCGCPLHTEARARSSIQSPLMDQLQEAVTEPTVTGGGEGGATDKPHSVAPGNQEALELSLRVSQAAIRHYQQLRAALYPDHAPGIRVSGPNALRQIADWCAMAGDGTVECGEDLVCEVKEDLRKLVRSARIILGYDSPQRMLESTVCGTCGGALIVADDASTDVRCIGTPDAPSCGTRYYRWQWIDLLEGEGA